MLGQTDDAADTVAQMRQLAAQDPEAAQKLAADLMAALARAGAAVPGESAPDPAPGLVLSTAASEESPSVDSPSP
ncbi:hypothetical protein [Phytohabitans aurantiacus]|jgi:hypothetical protein|uniref:Uncharacterized protein n=1 Tax=Phytohabitans aurantiacus TaxID=3016789 RepID=A0ABQ5QJT1_9ACTN|nr:hypothetical protein [Phytohabitans aurantiacus]GLH94765.1 hypothetical protein Pa4123_00370 [Phytohabitans aurantiacus]